MPKYFYLKVHKPWDWHHIYSKSLVYISKLYFSPARISRYRKLSLVTGDLLYSHIVMTFTTVNCYFLKPSFVRICMTAVMYSTKSLSDSMFLPSLSDLYAGQMVTCDIESICLSQLSQNHKSLLYLGSLW